jgi:hypothetical protein
MADQSFEEWMAKVDAVLGRLVGVSHDDLPDQLWRDWYDDGLAANTAAMRALRAAAGEDD